MATATPTRHDLVRRGRQLEYFTIVYNSAEGLVSIVAGLVAGSVSLIGFGLDSFIEVASGARRPNYNINVPNSAPGAGINGNLGNGGNNINMFSNPVATFNQFRPCILGYDTSCGSSGQIRGLANWNMDMNVAKDINLFGERVSGTLSFQFVNVFNHAVLRDPYLDISDPADFGVLGSNNLNGSGQLNSPRQLTFSLRLRF